MDLIKMLKGRDLLVLDRYSFLKERKYINGKLIWKCSEHKDSKCIACYHTVDDVLVKNIAVHHHVPA